MQTTTSNGAVPTSTEYPIADWVEQFHREGYLVLHDILPPDLIEELKVDLDRALADGKEDSVYGIDLETRKFVRSQYGMDLETRMFEQSRANLRLFDWEPVVSFAEALIAPPCHVIHNNSFRTHTDGAISGWHQDDPPHFLVTEGEPPTNIRLPVLLFTANYYLTDVTEPKYGPTEVIPGSHMFGASPPSDMKGTKWEDKVVPCLGKAGTVVMFNNQVWHRGAPNESDRIRYITQISYARRLIGHKYYPFMNYVMPEHVYANADKRLKRLLGFLPSGAYG